MAPKGGRGHSSALDAIRAARQEGLSSEELRERFRGRWSPARFSQLLRLTQNVDNLPAVGIAAAADAVPVPVAVAPLPSAPRVDDEPMHAGFGRSGRSRSRGRVAPRPPPHAPARAPARRRWRGRLLGEAPAEPPERARSRSRGRGLYIESLFGFSKEVMLLQF